MELIKKFYTNTTAEGTNKPMFEVGPPKYSMLSHLCFGEFAESKVIKSRIEEIESVINGDLTNVDIAADDWCILEVNAKDTRIINGFDEFEPLSITTNEILELFTDWYHYLLTYEKNQDIGRTKINEDYDKEKAVSSQAKEKDQLFKGMKHFNNMMQKFDMALVVDDSYNYGAVRIKNEKCEIDFSLDRYYNQLTIYFINPINHKEYLYGQIMRERKVYEKEKQMSLEQPKKMNLEKKLRNIAFLMEKYCSDIILGDFSALEKLDA